MKVYTGNKFVIDPNTDPLIRPYPLNRNVDLMDKTMTCGANNWYFENRTLDFVVTRFGNCMVHVYVTNSA